MEWEEEDYFSFDSDDDHNPVIRKRCRRESDPSKDGREGRQSSNEEALTSSQIGNPERKVCEDDIVLKGEGETKPLLLKSNSFERDSICRDPSIFVNPDGNSFKSEEDDEKVSRTLEGKDVKTELEENSQILKNLQDVEELKLILFARNANVFYDGENKMQAPLEKVLELAPNLQSLSVYVGDPPEYFRLPTPPTNLPHLRKLSLDSLVGMARVDYALFEKFFPQLLELKIDANGWKDEYNEAGVFPNLRTLILSGISGNEAHCWKMLKIFHNLNVPSLKVLELRLYHANNMEKYVDVENTLRIGTAALDKRFEGKWEGRLVGVEGCGCRKLRFSIVSEPEGENDKASDEKEGADDGHQASALEREEDFKISLEVGNNAGSPEDEERVSNFGESDPGSRAFERNDGLEVETPGENDGREPLKTLNGNENAVNADVIEENGCKWVATLKQKDFQDLTLIAGNSMQSDPGNIFGENVVQAPMTSVGKVLELTPNLQCLSVYWSPPYDILKPLPSLPHLTSLTFKTFTGMTSADFGVFQTYFPQLLELQIEEFNCWKDEYNEAGLFPNLRILILGGIHCGNKTHWGKLLRIFETLKAPSLNILELRLNLPKNLVEIREVKKCLRIGTFALNNRFGNVIGAWDVTQNYFIERDYRKLRFSIKSEQKGGIGTGNTSKGLLGLGTKN